MKKIIITVLLALLLVNLTGCGEKNNFDMNKASNTTESTLKDMKEIDKETLEDVYALDTSKMKNFIFKENKDGDFYAIIETSNINEVKTNMKDYFSKVKQFNQTYSPERLELLENRVEKEIDSYLIYIIAEDADKIYDKIVEGL